MKYIKLYESFINENISYLDNNNKVKNLQNSLVDLGINIGSFGEKSDGIDGIAGNYTFNGVKIILDLIDNSNIKNELEIDDEIFQHDGSKITTDQYNFITKNKDNKELKKLIKSKNKELEKKYKKLSKISRPNKVKKYIEKYGNQAVEASQKTYEDTGEILFPSVILAQSALDRGWGKSGLTRKANNFFGIKVRGRTPWSGDSIEMKTREVYNGKSVYVKEPFRKYDTAKDSFVDRNNFLLDNPRYRKNGVFDAKTPIEQIEALKRAGYATATDYVDLITNILYSNNLDVFDEKLKIS